MNTRSVKMLELFKAGKTLQEIGDTYHVSRERVRQILKKDFNYSWEWGGAHFKALINKNNKLSKSTAWFCRKFGCLPEEETVYRILKRERRLFNQQRTNSIRRGIEWKLTFPEWWQIWKESGKYDNRGKGKNGFCMARKGDIGPYSKDNVYIDNFIDNLTVNAPKWRGYKNKIKNNLMITNFYD